ncbi:hypothetical protein VXP99_08885 [Acinetobacter towneri]|uniref:hypothetical protein n=1 Tax=Acinetobacter towneri TaxID=202956 RepID=UPI003A8A3B75
MPLPNILEFIGTNITQRKFQEAQEKLLNYLGIEVPTKTELNSEISKLNNAITPKADKIYVDANLTAISGGHKAYQTLSAAQAAQASLPANTVVEVTNDGANNGTYQWNGTTLTKSDYDPLAQGKSFTTDEIRKLKQENGGTLNLDILKIHERYPSISGATWLKNTRYQGYLLSVRAGESYKITANSLFPCVAYTFEADIDRISTITGAVNVAKVINIPAGQSSTVTVTGTDNILWISHNFDTRNEKPSEVLKLNAFLEKSKIVGSQYTNLRDAVVNSQAIKDLSISVENLKSQVGDGLVDEDFKLLEITGLKGLFTETTHAIVKDTGLVPNVKRVTFPLTAGDVLEFSYHPTMGSTLIQHITSTTGYTLLGQVKNDKSIIRTYKYTVLESGDYSIVDYIEGSISVNGMAIDMQSTTILLNEPRMTARGRPSFRETEEWLIYESTAPLYVNRGDVIKIEGAVVGEVAIWADLNIPSGWWVAVRSVPSSLQTDVVEWVAPERMKVFLQGKAGAKYYIKRAASLKNALLENRKPIEPDSIVGVTLPPIETVFATHLSFILKTEMIDDVEHIAISQNLGKTWTYTPNIIGKIVNYHFFTDGTILLSSEKECYWTDDYVTLNKSTILRKDGTPWVRESENSLNFFGQQNGDKPMFVDGQEVYVWGEYAIGSTTVGVWYTTDFGRTIKRAVDFVGENFNGVPVTARHIHKVYYHAKQETFYVMTGDNDDENMLVKAKYNLISDTWTWEVLGKGHKYKFGNMWCDDYYAYFTTDYTVNSFKEYWGVLRVGLNHLNDPSKFRLAWDAKAGGWGGGSPYRFIADRNGNKVLIGELYTYGYIMVATTGYDFKRVNLDEPVVLSFIIGPNDNGDIYMKADLYGRGLATNSGQRLTGGTVNITKMLRNAGLVNFMAGEQNTPHLPFTSE